MKERTTYIGTLNGVNGVWCDQKPEGLEIKQEITFYTPDEGKVFADKEDNLVDSVVIQDGVDIKNYVEVIDPRKDRENDQAEM